MTLRLSTGYRNNLCSHSGFSSSFMGGVIDIYSGSQPATADSAVTGTLLGRVSIASTTYVAETPASATITVAGTAGTIATLNIGTFNILPLGAVTYDTDAATTALALYHAINRNGVYRATYPGSGAIVTVVAPPGTGDAHNGLALAATVTGGTTATSSGNITGGVDATAGLTFGAPSAGAISKSGVWSFNGLAIGTAGYFRFKASAVDGDGVSTTLVRADGSIAVSGADMSLSNISITVGAPVTIDTFTYTQPAQ